MAKLPQKDSHNKNQSPLEGNDKVFGETPRHHIIAEMVRYQMAKKRAGTASAKTRSYISRSGAKPFAQKGTGRARQGDVRSPLLEGGGVIFPPEPRSYSFSIPKNARKAALRSILSQKLRAGNLLVLSDHGIKGIKTKDARSLVDRLGLKKTLFILPAKDEVFEKSVRNLSGVKALRVEGLNVYDCLNFDQVVLLKEALPLIEKRLS